MNTNRTVDRSTQLANILMAISLNPLLADDYIEELKEASELINGTHWTDEEPDIELPKRAILDDWDG